MATETLAAEIDYPCSDGKPVAESDIHIDVLLDVRSRLKARYADRDDVYAAGNMLVYYVRDKPRKSLAPDAFVVFGVPNRLRETFKTWDEGAFPSVVFEFTSRTTKKEDLVTKFNIYQNDWKVQEYFLFDPRNEYLEPSLQGFRLIRGKLVPMTSVDGVLTSDVLGLTLSRDGMWLVLTDTATGEEVLTPDEREASDQRNARESAERDARDQRNARESAEREASDQRHARESAEAENVRLKAELAALRSQKPTE